MEKLEVFRKIQELLILIVVYMWSGRKVDFLLGNLNLGLLIWQFDDIIGEFRDRPGTQSAKFL